MRKFVQLLLLLISLAVFFQATLYISGRTRTSVSVTDDGAFRRLKYSVLRKEVPGLSFGGIQVGQTLEEIRESLLPGWAVVRDKDAYLVRGNDRKAMIQIFFEDPQHPRVVTSVHGYATAGLCYDQSLILPRIEAPDASVVQLPNLKRVQHRYASSRMTFLDTKDSREVTFQLMHNRVQRVFLGWSGQSWD